jgi:PmbA protein
VALAASNGFAGTYVGTGHGVSVAVLAGEGTKMERDYDYSSAVHAGDVEDAATVGRRAGERAVKRLGARKVATCKVPVIYDPRVAGSLLRHLLGAISGPSVARGTSFLKDKLGARVFAPGVTIVDDPHKRRGLRSRPFDGEGVQNRRRTIVADGVLETWILDLASARQLGLETTGHASRGTGGPPGPSPSNLWLEPGPVTPAELMADIDSGFYVTELMGMGVNGITGDYSRGAAGFWIEHGQLAYPVSEVTIAGNLKDMFQHMTAANDLRFRTGVDSPTVRIDGLTVAGA